MECYPQPNMNKKYPHNILLFPFIQTGPKKKKKLYHLSEDDSVFMQTKPPHLARSLSDTKPECKHG